MVITKTKFINYTRCDSFAKLDKINNKNNFNSVSYEDYKKEELMEDRIELYNSMFFDEEINIYENSQVDAMLPFYKQVEVEAGKIAEKYFGGSFIYAEKTKDQKCFKAKIDNDDFLCYVDLYNGKEIIEVKATTTNELLDLKIDNIPIFDKKNNVISLKKDALLNKKIDKLLDRFSSVGKYFFDLAVQRYIVEHSGDDKNYHYYLAYLNSNYVYDGSGEYHMINGEELITFIDANEITKMYQKIIEDLLINLKENLKNDNNKILLGNYCCRKKLNECPYFNLVCGKKIPKSNSIFSYLNCYQFKDENNNTRKCIDLVNEGYLDMLDIPDSWITQIKHKIQRNAYKTGEVYIDKEKIIMGLKQLKYPIYHLDFETFPCPIPRFNGEKPYTQSPFEFSLHIEREPGKCDFDKDNYVFLAKSFDKDERENLIKALIEHIPGDGTMFAQNYFFEKSRIIELANAFPEYKADLYKIINNSFDLMYLLNTNKDLYMKLGFNEKRALLPNYYARELSGSYSIKKTLPLFSDLSYDNLSIHNGTDAVIVYSRYNDMSNDEFEKNYNDLISYCKQDTWAMVVILDALRKIVK